MERFLAPSHFIFTLHMSNLRGLQEVYMITDYFANVVKNRMVSTLCYNWENIIQEKATTSIIVKELMKSRAARSLFKY